MASIVDKIAYPFDKPRKRVMLDGLSSPVYALQFNEKEERLLSNILQAVKKDQAAGHTESYMKPPEKGEWYVSDKRDAHYLEEALMIASDGSPNYTEPEGFLKMMQIHKGKDSMDTGFQSIYSEEGSYGTWKRHLPDPSANPWAAGLLSRVAERHDRTVSAYEQTKAVLLDHRSGKYAPGWNPQKPEPGSMEEKIILARYNESLENADVDLPRLHTLKDKDTDTWKTVLNRYQDSLISDMYNDMRSLTEK
jgi:hypothetical protein